MITALLFCSSCATAKKAANSGCFERPEVPDFYDENDLPLISYRDDSDRVYMPLYIWKRTVRYIIEAEAALDIAEELLNPTE